jgi:hypothetical protein
MSALSIPPSGVQPILVVLVWRGGERFQRALTSLAQTEKYFKRIIISITSEVESDDVRIANTYLADSAQRGVDSKIEIICTGRELPTMQHQRFWIDHLRGSGSKPNDWILWLAYDDELRRSGIEAVTNPDHSWPLEPDVAYLGPWAIRHETAELMWDGDLNQALESWTSFPAQGPTRLKTSDWLFQQLAQPTYIQMSGSVMTLGSHERLVSGIKPKAGPMRIEMATALSSTHIAEFSEPITTIYGRSNSDRSNYSKTAREEDWDLLLRILAHAIRHPISVIKNGSIFAGKRFRSIVRGVSPREEWRIRSMVSGQ